MMKRLLLFIFILILAIPSILSQHSTMSFGGTISGNVTWNTYDTIYITGTVDIVPGASLTISPRTGGTDIGTYVVFLGDHGFYITGTLNVNGTETEKIYFTADRAEAGLPKGDKVFGETGEVWRNLSFDLADGNSIIAHAVIEYGTGDDYEVGGGIDIYGSNVIVRNTTIRNCFSPSDGGGIFVESLTANVTLSHLKIHNNNASGNGGGLFANGIITLENSEIHNNNAGDGDGLYLNSPNSKIQNSIIRNHSGDGAYINASGCSFSNCLFYNNTFGIRFGFVGSMINCNIVNNTTGIRSISFNAPKIVNSVLWGNGSEYTIGGSSYKLEFANCAIEGGLLGLTGEINGGNNRNLSSINNADTGPNFINPSSPDLHIDSRIAPMVDGGISSYTGVTIPNTDIEGNPRTGQTDIGAYEFFYYIWSGAVSTSWSTSGNWLGSPSSVPTSFSEDKVVIPNACPRYPIITGDITLSDRSILTIESQATLEVTGLTTVNAGCTFNLKSDAGGTANFICGAGAGSVSGSFTVEMYLAGGGAPNHKWHYFTTPVDEHTTNPLTIDIGNNNLLQYLEPEVVSNKDEGWQWHDGHESTIGFGTLRHKRGYNVYVPDSRIIEFFGPIWDGRDISWSNTELSCGIGDPNERGWNLLCNPFTSVVDAESFVFGTDLWGPDPLDRVIYFTKNNGFISYNTYTHTGTAQGEVVASRYVPALQGFFVHAKGGGRTKTLRIPASGRVNSVSTLYKGSKDISSTKSIDFPYLKLNVTDGAISSDETIVYFFNDASITFDGLYDAYKFFNKNVLATQMYTVSNSINLAMNGLPYPEPTTSVPLKIWTGETKSYTINVLNLDNLSDYKVSIIHGENTVDLKSNPNYTFSGIAGTTINMTIAFENLSTDIPEILYPAKDQIQCWHKNGNLSVKSEAQGFENATLTVYDINGRTVYLNNNISLPHGEILELPVNLRNGLYICTLSKGNLRINRKIVVVE